MFLYLQNLTAGEKESANGEGNPLVPYVGGIYRRDFHMHNTPMCIGAVLTENFVITAAHCFDGRNKR